MDFKGLALTKRGVLHRYPAYEACNLDEAKAEAIVGTIEEAMDTGKYRRHCMRCFTTEERALREQGQ